ncbi:enoyl-CoA hydratase/isomerase family protein [Bacillus sp. Marseille-P3661]|uniref:enoyl-CoA hydratase/isomerase family protein n=1 Tax=Bacillus sp. Marseille-P3661 TaxID=1936234 RepID=UPI000C84F410|nr:enoyl-CoA hydratase/isomerase family protein [Bacillus sp. Marseille-P3661]
MDNKLYTNVKGFVAEIVLNRPEFRNAINLAMWKSLPVKLREFERNPDIRVIIITGEGDQAFSAGADFGDLAAVAGNEQLVDPILTAVEETMSTIEQLTKPVIAKINGAAIGGGCELAASCDIRIASDQAKFGIPAGKLGIAITGQDTRRLSSLVGVGWTRDLLMTGRIIDSQTALHIGLVTRVVPHEELDRETEILAEQIGKMAALTLKAAKVHSLEIIRAQELTSKDGFSIAKDAWASNEFKKRVSAVREKSKTK